jgi:hypothetical protein
MDPELCDKIKSMMAADKNLCVMTIGALGIEMVNGVKEDLTG